LKENHCRVDKTLDDDDDDDDDDDCILGFDPV
jgi:hypothetical protein